MGQEVGRLIIVMYACQVDVYVNVSRYIWSHFVVMEVFLDMCWYVS